MNLKKCAIRKVICFILLIAGLAFLPYGCKTTEPQLQHCYNNEWQDVLVVDIPEGGHLILNGEQIVIPKGSQVLIIGNVIN